MFIGNPLTKYPNAIGCVLNGILNSLGLVYLIETN